MDNNSGCPRTLSNQYFDSPIRRRTLDPQSPTETGGVRIDPLNLLFLKQKILHIVTTGHQEKLYPYVCVNR